VSAERLVKKYVSQFESYLQSHPVQGRPEELYNPINYILSIGGKRIRPTMVLMASEIAGGKSEEALPVAMAIELFHNFTLIHDDIMDEADIRRNMATVHKKYGTNTAILSGDVMMVYAYEYLIQNKYWQKILPIFNKTAIEVCEGQQLDLNFETSDHVDLDTYMEMIKLKTAVLLACGFQVGAMSVGGPDKLSSELYDFALNLGMAFQIQDDVLDTYATNASFGKKIGGDIIMNKKTYLLLKAMELASDSQRAELRNAMANTNLDDEDKVRQVISLYDQLDVKNKAMAASDSYLKKALSVLEQMQVDDDHKQNLNSFAELLVQRSK